MKKIFDYKNIRIVITLVIFAILMTSTRFTTAQTGNIDQEIQDLNIKIQNQKIQLDIIQAQRQKYQEQIRLKANDRITLSNQLSILEDRLKQAQLDIDSVNLEINKTTLEIKKVELDSTNLEEQINSQKNHLGSLLQSMYKQSQMSTLESLLVNNSLSDFLNQVKYLNDTNQELQNSVNNLKNQKTQLDQDILTLQQKNSDLASLKDQINIKRDDLGYEQENKNNLLTETKSSERQYQTLLQQGIAQQQQAEADIASAENLVRQKMSLKDKKLLDSSDKTIDWPVPKNRINTTFHDPDYPYRKIIGEHSAIDIRAAQGTTLTAAASGYVAKVKFDGTKNYAYIMIIHGNGLSTVYGHVSAVYVTTDQYVTQGETIGRSGGTPGGIGSGPFTTGPHLHFEVRLNGMPVNPLSYLQ